MILIWEGTLENSNNRYRLLCEPQFSWSSLSLHMKQVDYFNNEYWELLVENNATRALIHRLVMLVIKEYCEKITYPKPLPIEHIFTTDNPSSRPKLSPTNPPQAS